MLQIEYALLGCGLRGRLGGHRWRRSRKGEIPVPSTRNLLLLGLLMMAGLVSFIFLVLVFMVFILVFVLILAARRTIAMLFC